MFHRMEDHPGTCPRGELNPSCIPKPGFLGQRLWWPQTSCHSLPGALPQPRHSQMDFVVETGDALVCPVFPQLGQNVAQSVRPRATEEGSL